MSELVDTHCHIQSAGNTAGERITREIWAKSPALNGKQLVDNAAAAGVTRLLCVGCDLEDSQLAVDFVQDQPSCWASIGIHPHEAQHLFDRDASEGVAKFAALASQPKVVAVGECGLDFHYNHSPRTAQIKALEFQIELALAAELPLVFHVREAFDDFWPIFDNYQGLRGVLHSFTDSAENLDKALACGLHIGVNGIATFAKDPAQLEIYRAIPLEKLVLETDAPFLTPAPHRSAINEPKNVAVIADFLAELRNEDRDKLVVATTHNARQLFEI